MRAGYTTGTCAAVAARGAALYLLKNEKHAALEYLTPAGLTFQIPLQDLQKDRHSASCTVVKMAGDDPDVTGGSSIQATVTLLEQPGLLIKGGKGVGKVTRAGLKVPPGEPAINPGPRQQIEDALSDLLPSGTGFEVTISVPGGEALASRTLNPQLGIEGGISILGSDGVVLPMSEERFKESLNPQFSVIRAAGYRTGVFTPGKRSYRLAAETYGLPKEAMAIISNFVGYALDQCMDHGFERVLLLGHQGKIMKIAAGIFHTGSRTADARREITTAYAAWEGAPFPLLQKLWETQTAEESFRLLKKEGLEKMYHRIASEAAQRASQRAGLPVGAALLNLEGEMIGWDQNARLVFSALAGKSFPFPPENRER